MQHVIAGDRAASRVLWRSLALVGLVTIVTAYFSDLFYFPDEHYQVLEFMSRKLGTTQPTDMPWEYFARIRSWMQPFIYYLIAWPLMTLGLKDLFHITFVLRLLTGVLSWIALALFARETLKSLEGAEERLSFARYLPWFGFLPYLFVRTASETMSAAFFTLGLALVMNRQNPRRLLAAGLLCGLAFVCRYQSAFLILGLMAWLTLIARTRVNGLALFCAGLVLALGAGTLVDYWGYGAFNFTPWLYFKANILDGVAAKSFGRDPVYAYLYMGLANIFLPISLVLMAAMAMMWARNPRHVITWVTVPFILIHSLIAHKEPRFLFPLAIIAVAFPVLGFSPLLPRARALAARLWSWRASPGAKFVTTCSAAAMLFLAVYPLGLRPHMPMAKYVYRHFPGGLHAYSLDAEPFTSYPMYRPAAFQSQHLANRAALASQLQMGPVYLFSNSTTLPDGALPDGARATMLYSEFPLADFGYALQGRDYLKAFADFSARAAFLKLPPLYWITLFRVEPATRSYRANNDAKCCSTVRTRLSAAWAAAPD